MVGNVHDDAHVVLDQQHADAVELPDRNQQLVELSAGLTRIEPGRRFVETEQPWFGAHGAGDLEAALGAVRKITSGPIGGFDEIDALQPSAPSSTALASAAR